MKKLFTLLLALALVLSLGVTAFASDSGGAAGTGGGTITVTNAHIGEDYKLYRIFDLTVSADKTKYSYRLDPNSSWAPFFADGQPGATYFTVDPDTHHVDQKDAVKGTGINKFADAAMEYVASNDVTVIQEVKNNQESTITFENLPFGYYMIDTTVGTVVAINSNSSNINVQDKSADPRVDKTVHEDDGDAWGDKNTAAILQTVDYKVKISAIARLNNVVFHDTMSEGLTFINPNVGDANYATDKLKIIVVEGEAKAPIEDTDYTIVTDGLADGCTFEIRFNDDYTYTLKRTDVLEVQYKAQLNDKAIIAREGNLNTVELSYGNNQRTTKDTTTTYTWGINVFKYWENPSTTETRTPLAGAKFILMKDRANETPAYVKSIGSNSNITMWTYNRDEALELVSDDKGLIYVAGLDSDKYQLIETVPPDGFYNQLNEPVKFDISQEGVVRTDYVNIVDRIEIKNSYGSELPSTGGFGTTLFITFGMLGVMVFGVLMVTNKRMKKEGY